MRKHPGARHAAIVLIALLPMSTAWAQSKSTSPLQAPSKVNGPPPLPNLDVDAIGKTISSALPPQPPKATEVVVLQLRGQYSDGGIDGTQISPMAMKLMLDICLQRKPAAVVLDIDSPGGLASAMENIIDQVLKAQAESGLRVVAWPRDAHSAAALTCMSCREIVVRPLSRIGAATLVRGEDAAPGPETAMDHKLESSRQARRRQIAQTTGRDIKILDAMQYPERELWYRSGDGFREVPQAGAGWMALDDSADAPATLNAEELRATGIALGIASNETELKGLLKLPQGSPVCVIDLGDSKITKALKPTTDAVNRWIEWRDDQVAKFTKIVTDKTKKISDAANRVAALMESEKGWTNAQQDEVGRKVENCTYMPRLGDELKSVVDGSLWLSCLEGCMEMAKMHADKARDAMKPQNTGGGRVVNLEAVHENLIKSHNALIDFLNGCEE